MLFIILIFYNIETYINKILDYFFLFYFIYLFYIL